MPFKIRPKGDKFEVYNTDTGESKGESDTKEMAEKHMAALYANSKDVKKVDTTVPLDWPQ